MEVKIEFIRTQGRGDAVVQCIIFCLQVPWKDSKKALLYRNAYDSRCLMDNLRIFGVCSEQFWKKNKSYAEMVEANCPNVDLIFEKYSQPTRIQMQTKPCAKFEISYQGDHARKYFQQ